MIIEYSIKFAYALEEAGKGPISTHIRNMQRREENVTLAKWIKNIKNKLRKPVTNFVIQQQTDVDTLEITEKILQEKVIISENLKKYHKIKGDCPLIYDPCLYLDIRAFGEGPQVEDILDGKYVCP